MPRLEPAKSAASLIAQALSLAVGPALVLDGDLRVLLATADAARVLGFDVPLGASAPKLLCRNSPKREVAAAMSQGLAIQTTIAHPADDAGERRLKLRALPLGAPPNAGFLLMLDEAPSSSSEPVLFQGMWTENARLKEVFRIIERVAVDDATVLVRGETGTGKELVARAIHALSPRAGGPFQAINCAALPANLLESELFGHVRGAFTGADRDTKGHLQLAHKGTLFLDEVAEMPLELQPKLLRVLETRSVLPVGGRTPVPIDVRVISATHRALRREVELNRFRADLMYRLRVIPIFLPALRERKEDIALLIEKLCESMNKAARRKVERIAPSALALLERHDWPGNIRELRNVIAYAYAIGEGPILQIKDLPIELVDAGGPSEGAQASERLRELAARDPEVRRILQALEKAGGRRHRAAKILGISRVTLWRRMRELGLDEDEPSAEPRD
ncbi:MAG TPA: sigma 54-interacting transcriptional regulator [Polyangiaceae bacterium]|nr:sigma 54-interacting transcriptional regulator [Polyangiaceae bacterium]